MRKKMKTKEEIKKELLASKERLERALARLEEEEYVTLQVEYEDERYDIVTIPQTRLGPMYGSGMQDFEDKWVITRRTTGPLAGKAFLLNEEYDWELGRDTELRLCLVPIKKDK